MLKTSVNRKGKRTPIPASDKKRAHRRQCQCCGAVYGHLRAFGEGKKIIHVRESFDHMLPFHWMVEHGFAPHGANIISICNRCNSIKRGFEDSLFRGDIRTWMRELSKMNYPLDQFLRFVSTLDLKGFDGWNI